MRGKRRNGPFTFFVDECIKCSLIVDVLQNNCLRNEYVKIAPKGTLDEDWLRDAGINGWVCFTGDHRLLVRPNEIAAIQYYGVKLFTLSNATGSEYAARISRSLKIVRRAAATLKKAFVARIEDSGDLTVILEGGKLLKRRAECFG